MIVVADASALNYLIQIECENLLQRLFGRVLIPVAVIEELRHPAAPPPRFGSGTFPSGLRFVQSLPIRIQLSMFWTLVNERPSNWPWSSVPNFS